MVHLNAHDTDTDSALVNETITALTMQAILKVFSSKQALTLSVLLKRGDSSILSMLHLFSCRLPAVSQIDIDQYDGLLL